MCWCGKNVHQTTLKRVFFYLSAELLDKLSSHYARLDLIKVVNKIVQAVKLSQPKLIYLALSSLFFFLALFHSGLSDLNIKLCPLQSSLLLLVTHLCLRPFQSRRQHGRHSKICVFTSHFAFLSLHFANPVAQRDLRRRIIGQDFRTHWTNHDCTKINLHCCKTTLAIAQGQQISLSAPNA